MRLIVFVVMAVLVSGQAQAKEKEIPELNAWIACVKLKAASYARMDVPVETAAKGALGACKSEEDAYFDVLTKPSFSEKLIEGKWPAEARKREQVAKWRSEQVPDVEARTIALILDIRASSAQTPSTPSQAQQ